MAPSSLLLPLSLALLCLLYASFSTYKSFAKFTFISILIFKKKIKNDISDDTSSDIKKTNLKI